MTEDLVPPLAPILLAALVAQASPGPATLAIAHESMAHGRRAGVALALGVTTGSWTWSAIAAAGMSALILAHESLVMALRIAAALYLGWLAIKSARAALGPRAENDRTASPATGRSYLRGLLIHLTNPKAILFFSARYAFGTPTNAGWTSILSVAGAVAIQSLVIFVGLALLFSDARLAAGFARLRRACEVVFAFVLGSAALAVLGDLLRPMSAAFDRSAR